MESVGITVSFLTNKLVYNNNNNNDDDDDNNNNNKNNNNNNINSNWTEWSTIQGVIARVISKSDKREARGRFEITSMISP